MNYSNFINIQQQPHCCKTTVQLGFSIIVVTRL